MQFELDEERALLQSSSRELLEKEAPLAETRSVMEDSAEGFNKAFYAQLGELGYLGLLVPEAEGGSGMGAVGLAAVLAEMGRVAFPGPYLEQVLAIDALRRCDGAEAARWLERCMAGEALIVFARREGAAGREPAQPATRCVESRITGRKTFVAFGATADALLATTADGLALVPRPDAGWSATPLPTIDHAQRFAEIALDAPAALLAEPARARALLQEVDRIGALGAAAMLLGLMERALELTVAYTMEREAFGTVIATFQALQHRCADMLLKTESTRSAVFRAAWAADAAPAEFPYLAAVAKAWAGDAGRFVCGEALQLHGGVGYTWEYDPHIYLKRVKTLEQFYGTTREQIEEALCRAPCLGARRERDPARSD
jgi:alkylation response protein AidB-like acyl-CoA dehydrogenase